MRLSQIQKVVLSPHFQRCFFSLSSTGPAIDEAVRTDVLTDAQTYRRTDVQTYRCTDRHTDRQTYRRTDRQTYRQTDRRTDVQTDRQMH